jgi:hypothetical protein
METLAASISLLLQILLQSAWECNLFFHMLISIPLNEIDGLYGSSIFNIFGGTEVCIQDFVLARQALNCLSHTSRIFIIF